MSTNANVPQPPPPPLPLFNIITSTLNTTAKCNQTKMITFDVNICPWASHIEEVHRACSIARICLTESPIAAKYRIVKSLTQDGPMCGLVALTMLLNGSPTEYELLKEAKAKQFTNNGEMFSADNLHKLLQGNATNLKSELYYGNLDSEYVRGKLMENALLLVPYDADCDHRPCLKNGHKAHWALILGYLIDNHNKFYVFAKHGKSKHLQIWSLDELNASNLNLYECAKSEKYTTLDFILPLDGIDSKYGLRKNSIIIYNCDSLSPTSLINI